MLKLNDVLQKTSNTVALIAGISFCLAITAISAVAVKENIQQLLKRRKKVTIVSIEKVPEHDFPEARESEEEKPSRNKKGQFTKKSSKVTHGELKMADMNAEDPEAKNAVPFFETEE